MPPTMSLPLTGDSSFFMDLYARYLRDPAAVPADWRLHFETLDLKDDRGAPAGDGESLCEAYRRFGYREARLDPLGLAASATMAELQPGPSPAAPLRLSIAGSPRYLAPAEAHDLLRQIYCSGSAIEASHVTETSDRQWLHETYEREMLAEAAEPQLAEALEAVLRADEFERFIKTKWPTKKRFGSEGSESSAVILRECFRMAAADHAREVVIGGMHRGRLATLATVAGKSLATLIAEIKGVDVTGGGAFFTGDVPYHNGLATRVKTSAGEIAVRILPHPSHLIVVAPVALGAARARAESWAQEGVENAVLPLLMHTDAAFAGQGLVSEILQLGGLKGYSAGGTVHLVVNNQIGFTTLPEEGRSTPSPTDIGKAYGIPVFHVNGDDPLAAAAVARVAYLWRRHSGRDAIIDLVCYRRNGHNELDEPRFTQPRIWSVIDQHESLKTSFTQRVQDLSPAAHQRAEDARQAFSAALDEAFRSYDKPQPNSSGQETIVFPVGRRGENAARATGLPIEALQSLGRTITACPVDVELDPKVQTFLETRREAIAAGGPINLATAESLAFASLLAEGTSVRLSGQDSVRGTFTQRHLAVHDRRSGESVMPLAQAATGSARFEAINSPLIEYGVLGFEYGMSLADPDRLVMWEAQFGDFLNGAQIAVDQYITTAEAKWRMQSSLVISLPHGLEGQGPDHSSARIERILQSCVGDNIILANPSTPANLFHLLRRQQRGAERKPLFLIAPKALLRDKRCVSPLSAFGPGTEFEPVLCLAPAQPAARVILCSGKIFYALEDERSRLGLADTAIIRIEQLYPFPLTDILALLQRFANAELIWCQEEPRNQGAFGYVREQLWDALPARTLRYAGRPPMAAAAGGSIERHEEEQAEIIASAFSGARPGRAAAE